MNKRLRLKGRRSFTLRDANGVEVTLMPPNLGEPFLSVEVSEERAEQLLKDYPHDFEPADSPITAKVISEQELEIERLKKELAEAKAEIAEVKAPRKKKGAV